ncbi:MAG: hypothetical protein NBV68_01345 [Erythrobacter sp.]|uniref:hypothetical protein n=1 Tax=Erythrobacter sp. TaxID=1042 RepID=UPI0025D8B8F6|nr:hypothetical protein [Erythrobacter sp.]MCL9998003.1 hypothetical protein [Erythrobacter sp.]
MRRTTLLGLGLIAAPVAAQATVHAVSTMHIEVAVTADLNGDGLDDSAMVVGDGGRRELRVVTSYRSETDSGENPPQVLPLDPGPLGDAVLEVKGDVLLLKELTGGTTAVASTHRFRWDGKLGAMRLIGLDATLYSRTFAHDGREASWNLLTGDLTSHRLKLRGDDSDVAYDEVDRQRKKKRSAPLRLERSPSGDDLLGWPGAK